LRHPAQFGSAITVQRRSMTGGGLDISDNPRRLHAGPSFYRDARNFRPPNEKLRGRVPD